MRRREWISFAAGAALAGGDQGGWIKSGRNPMLSLGQGDAFDSRNIMSPSIAKDGGRYYLFYAGGPLGPPKRRRVGALSTRVGAVFRWRELEEDR